MKMDKNMYDVEKKLMADSKTEFMMNINGAA
jgi:hypothetical protein